MIDKASNRLCDSAVSCLLIFTFIFMVIMKKIHWCLKYSSWSDYFISFDSCHFYFALMGWKPLHRTNSYIIFWTSNELKRVHLLVIELEHPIFGFENRTSNFIGISLDLLNSSSNWFEHLLFNMERTRTCSTVHLLEIKLDHPIFGFERPKIELRTLFEPSLFLHIVIDDFNFEMLHTCINVRAYSISIALKTLS